MQDKPQDADQDIDPRFDVSEATERAVKKSVDMFNEKNRVYASQAQTTSKFNFKGRELIEYRITVDLETAIQIDRITDKEETTRDKVIAELIRVGLAEYNNERKDPTVYQFKENDLYGTIDNWARKALVKDF